MKFVDSTDRWQPATADDAPVVLPAATDHRILSVAQWQAVRETWPGTLAIGLAVANDVDVESIADALPRLRLVALAFPAWTDGRAYTQARLLRVRHGFAGEIRATGEVLADMLPLLQRNGFDAVVLRSDQSIDVATRALGFFPQGHHQGDVIEPRPLFARFHATPKQ